MGPVVGPVCLLICWGSLVVSSAPQPTHLPVAGFYATLSCTAATINLDLLSPALLCCSDNLHEIIIIGRWVLLGLLGAQVLAIAVASLLRCCTRSRSYEEFQEEEQQQYELRTAAANEQLEQLKSKLQQQHAAAADVDGKRTIR